MLGAAHCDFRILNLTLYSESTPTQSSKWQKTSRNGSGLSSEEFEGREARGISQKMFRSKKNIPHQRTSIKAITSDPKSKNKFGLIECLYLLPPNINYRLQMGVCRVTRSRWCAFTFLVSQRIDQSPPQPTALT